MFAIGPGERRGEDGEEKNLPSGNIKKKSGSWKEEGRRKGKGSTLHVRRSSPSRELEA